MINAYTIKIKNWCMILFLFFIFPKKDYTPLVKIYTSSIPCSGRPCLDYPILHKRSRLFILHFQHVPNHHLHILSHMPSLSRPSFNSWEGGTTIWCMILLPPLTYRSMRKKWCTCVSTTHHRNSTHIGQPLLWEKHHPCSHTPDQCWMVLTRNMTNQPQTLRYQKEECH